MTARKIWYKIKVGLNLRTEYGPEGVTTHTVELGTWI